MKDLIMICMRFFLLGFSKVVLSIIPKKRNQIMFTSWFGTKYGDSSRYMFEYLLQDKKYKVVWMAKDKNLYLSLKNKGLPVVYGKSLSGIWTQIRSKMLVSSIQTSDYNPYFLRNCVFFDLDHGFALKECGDLIPGIPKWNIQFNHFVRWGVDFWQSAPTAFCMDKVCKCYSLTPDRIVHCNKPRTDVLFDKTLQHGLNKNIERIKAGRKAIVWMPTHRSDGKKPISISELLDLDKLQSLCARNNIVFIIKKHFYHKNEREDLERYPNIYDVTNEDVDSQVILSQADALVSDYSASYIEYLILDRPIILYAFDIDEYLKSERGLFIKFQDNTAGDKVYTSQELMKSIERIASDWYDTQFADGRKKARKLYFDKTVPAGFYRDSVKSIIDQLMEGTYCPDWNKV